MINETMDNLKKVTGVEILDTRTVEGKEVGFNLDDKDNGSISFDQNGIVSQIIFGISPSTELEIQEVINAFGAPNEVLIYECREEIVSLGCDTRAIYKDKGMVWTLLLPDTGNNDHQVEIEPDSKILKIEIFPDDVSAEASLDRSPFGTRFLFPWNGFMHYP